MPSFDDVSPDAAASTRPKESSSEDHLQENAKSIRTRNRTSLKNSKSQSKIERKNIIHGNKVHLSDEVVYDQNHPIHNNIDDDNSIYDDDHHHQNQFISPSSVSSRSYSKSSRYLSAPGSTSTNNSNATQQEDVTSQGSANSPGNSSTYSLYSCISKSSIHSKDPRNRSKDNLFDKNSQNILLNKSEMLTQPWGGLYRFLLHFKTALKTTICSKTSSMYAISLSLSLLALSLHMVSLFAIRPPQQGMDFNKYWIDYDSISNFAKHLKYVASSTYSCQELLVYLIFTAILNSLQSMSNLDPQNSFLVIFGLVPVIIFALDISYSNQLPLIFHNPVSIASLTIHHFILDLWLRLILSYFDDKNMAPLTKKSNRIPLTRSSKLKQNDTPILYTSNIFGKLYLSNITYKFLHALSKLYFKVFSLEISKNFEIRSALLNILIGSFLFTEYMTEHYIKHGKYSLHILLSDTIPMITLAFVLMHFVRGYKSSKDFNRKDTDAIFDLKFWKYSTKIICNLILVPIFSSYPLRFAILSALNNKNASSINVGHFFNLLLSLFSISSLFISDSSYFKSNSTTINTRSIRKSIKSKRSWSTIASQIFSPFMISEQIVTLSMILSHNNPNLFEILAMDSLFIRNIFDVMILYV